MTACPYDAKPDTACPHRIFINAVVVLANVRPAIAHCNSLAKCDKPDWPPKPMLRSPPHEL